ncbi:SET domain-containing protein [Aspergillus sclerotioniger CBS 115572]|uniref:SET domain-containing protein n=1 Tax=Aspergillus sclerotioniger CBS 115572 TaxID=1450535 RepID=A0A317X8P1_9EURO|nr:SET domain-containing protein [Aspergillus sclerotioniger CBS 115572]PWY94976.1 SET domain-containing protein [Aspergillus sclerotioniger CBS 115572]
MLPAYYPSVAALSELKKTLIKDLTPETHHRGSYLLLRDFTPTIIKNAIHAVVADESGDITILQLSSQESSIATDGRLAEGKVILIKEPYLTTMADGDCGWRVDHLSDIWFIPDHDPLVPFVWRSQPDTHASAASWKTKGNGHFNKAAYYLAIDCYSKALEFSPTLQEDITIRLNRALACLKTRQFDAALRDVELVLSKFRKSCGVHKMLSKAYPNNSAAKGEFSMVKARLMEAQSGQYPSKQLQQEATERRPPLLDRATYIGPVSVRSTESHGRSLFTTEAVQTGDLLLCEKAFAYASNDTTADSSTASHLMNPQTNTMMKGTKVELISLIAQKLYRNPSLMPTLTDLRHGSYTPADITAVDDKPVVDTFLIEQIVSVNCFSCPVSSRALHIRTIKEAKAQQHETTNNQHNSCGIWPLASYTNHSCYANCYRSFVGDMIIVRATQDLPANTELTFQYIHPNINPEFPDFQHWGFQCSCVICQDLRDTGDQDLAKRRQLMTDLETAFSLCYRPQNRRTEIPNIEGIISKIEKTYRRPSTEVPRLGIWGAYMSLAMVQTSRPQEAIRLVFRTLESLGYVVEGGKLPHAPGTRLLVKKWGFMIDGLVGCWMILCRAYCKEKCPDLAGQAERYARITYRMCVGEEETFGDTYSRDSDQVDGMVVVN